MNTIATASGTGVEQPPAAPAISETASAAPVFSRRNLLVAAGLFVLALVSLFILQELFHIDPFGVSPTPQFVYQAESFLHGKWNLDIPPNTHDIVLVHGKYYTIYPPFPAVLMLPFVAIFGLNTSDILLTTVCSAILLSLLYLLLEQVRANGLTKRSWRENLVMALFFYYGSLTLWLSLGGELWFTGQIVAVLMLVLALLLAFRRHYLWSAVALGCAFFSRSTVFMGFLLIFYLAWQDAGREHLLERFARSLWQRKPDWQAIPWRRLVPPLIVMVVVIALYVAHNALIFGTPLDSGYAYADSQIYTTIPDGIFSIKYVPRNIAVNLFGFPRLIFHYSFDPSPTLDMLNGGYGSSVFFTTPLFLLLFWRNRTFSLLRVAIWVTLGIFVATIMLYSGTGANEFGARYLVEGYPYAFLLLAMSDVRLGWRFVALGLLGVAFNLLGAHQFWTGQMIQIK